MPPCGRRAQPALDLVDETSRRIRAAGKCAGTLVVKQDATHLVAQGAQLLYYHADPFVADGVAVMRGKDNGAGKKDGVQAQWQKIKIDRQIVAIAKSRGAQLIVSSDDGVRSNALRVGIQALTLQELELPESAKQGKLELVIEPGALDIVVGARASGPP